MPLTHPAGSALSAPTQVTVSGTSQTAAEGGQYMLTNPAATTVELPSNPTGAATVWITWVNGLTTNVVARNGQNIMGLAEDMTLDSAANGNVQLGFFNATYGWRIL